MPVYNEAANLTPFTDELMGVVAATQLAWELLFIDDGSSDDSPAILLALAQRPGVRVVRLARNFGKEAALSAGLAACSGRAAVLMDCDLQHPPEILHDMLAQWRDGAHMVVGIRQWRDDQSTVRVVLTRWFYRILRRLSAVDIPPDAADFRLLDRAVIDVLNQLPERTRFMKGLYQWPGFSQRTLPFTMRPRRHGASRWSLRTLWRLAMDGLVSSSTAPLKIWTYAGLAVVSGTMVASGVLALRGVAGGPWPSMGTWLAIGVMGLLGLILLAQGIQGEYIARIYEEAKGRPLYVVQSAHGFDAGHPLAQAQRPVAPQVPSERATSGHVSN